MGRPSRMRRAAALMALVAALLGLPGCFKVSQDVEVRADGSGSVTLHAEINKKALAQLFDGLGGGIGGVTPNLVTPFRTLNRTFPDGTKVRAVDSTDRSTLDASFDFDGPDDYRRRLQEVNEAIAANPDASLPDDGSIEIHRVQDQMQVSLDPGTLTAGTADFNLAALSALLDADAQPELVVSITMPGSVLTSNGQVQGRTVTWDLLDRGAPAVLTASSEVDGTGAPTWALALGIGLILLVLVVSLAFLVSQRRRTAAGDGPDEHGPAGPWAPAGQPGTGTFFPPQPGSPPQDGWPVPPARPPAPTPVPTGTPPWQPSPWSFPTTTEAPPATWSGRPGGAAPPEPPGSRPSAARTPPGPPGAPATDDAPGPPPPAAGPEPAAADPPPWRAPAADVNALGSAAAPVEPAPTAETPAAVALEAGWYADPAGGAGLRYWDGTQWTQHTC